MRTRFRALLVLGLSLNLPVLVACGPSAPPDHDRPGPSSSGGMSGNPESCSLNDPGGSFAIAKTEPLLDDSSPSGPYRYRSVSIQGGGFVTGIEFSPIAKDVIFARTDVGGAYRWNGDHWMPVTDFLDRDNANALGIESIAFDPTNPDVIYLAGGMYVGAGNGSILRTTDGGLTWEHYGIGVPMGGNADGRSMGERLAVDPNQPTTLYFASRTLGLWRTTNSSSSWSRVTSFPVTGAANIGLSFVLFDPASGGAGKASSTIYVGVADIAGPNLYRSIDAGQTWTAVAGAPTGWMPHHAVLDAGGLYIAYNDAPGPNNVNRGAVYRYERASGRFRNITPPVDVGIGGLSLDRSRPGTLLASTLDWWAPDEIFRTTDDGATWQALGPCARRDDNGAKYLYFGGTQLSATGWMGDIEIDPFNPGRALYITGQGIWWSDDVNSADSNRPTHWTFLNDGLEETVALDLAVPPVGAELLSAVGDIGGFRHDDLEKPPEAGMYENPVFGNTVSIDFAELAPEVVVRAGTASSRSRRGAYSLDGGSSWTPFPTEPMGGRGEGTIAVSADAERVLWSARSAPPAYSVDLGQTWVAAIGLETGARVAADRVDPLRFYAVSADGGTFLTSDDGGATFVVTATGLSRVSGRPRPVFDNAGDVWLTTGSGLLRSRDAGQSFERVLPVEVAHAVGFGKAAADAEFPAVFLSGSVRGERGIFRSDDGGESFVRIDDPRRRFGQINAIAGDPRRFGRVFLGTGGRGILYGDPVDAGALD